MFENIKLFEGDKPANETEALALSKFYLFQQGWMTIGYEWRGPDWKPESHYMTNEGYPLGTVCWYVTVELHGRIIHVCRDTYEEAVWDAHLWLVEREKPHGGTLHSERTA